MLIGKVFNIEKATETAGAFLSKAGGKMPYMKLLKLLYLADRQALLARGRTITTDEFVSMNFGPVASNIYGLICTPSVPDGSSWHFHMRRVPQYDIELTVPTASDELSRAEERIIDEIWKLHGHLDQWKLSNLTHQFPEWKNPNGSSIPISVEDILKAGDVPEEQVVAIRSELVNLRHLQAI